MLAKILAKRHGFKCTILFSMNPKDGTVDPSVRNNIPEMGLLETADMMVLFAVDLTLPDEQMRPFVEFLETGKPVFGIRCSLLSFRYPKDSPYARFDVGNGGYATDLFGAPRKGHYGDHGKESEDLRRLYVNCTYWALGMESAIPPKADVGYIGGDWKASRFGGGKFIKGRMPKDFAIKAQE